MRRAIAPKIRVAILEDHQSIVDGYLYRLSRCPDIEVVFTTAYGAEFESFLASHPADVILTDVSVPISAQDSTRYPVLQLIPRLLQNIPHVSILVISMYLERALIQAALDAGASGYILKDDRAAIGQLGSIVQAVAAGGIYISQQAQQRLAERQPAEINLSPRQAEALSLCTEHPDYTTAQLAQEMHISNSTARNLLSNAYLRLGVRNRAAAIEKARRLGLLALAPQTT